MVPVKCMKKSSGMSIVRPERRLAKRRYAKRTPAASTNWVGAVWCVSLLIRNLRPEAPPELVRDHPSIHWDRGTRHVGRTCRSDKGDHMSDLLWCCETFDWHGRDERRFIFTCVGEACEHTRICSARSHHIHAHTGARDFKCSGLGQPFHRMFASYINGCAGSAEASIGGRDIDDAPAPLRQHRPQFVLHAQQHTQYVAVKSSRVALCGLVCYETAQAFSPGIVDCDIQSSETLDGLIHKVTHVIFMADVRTNKHGLCSERL